MLIGKDGQEIEERCAELLVGEMEREVEGVGGGGGRSRGDGGWGREGRRHGFGV